MQILSSKRTEWIKKRSTEANGIIIIKAIKLVSSILKRGNPSKYVANYRAFLKLLLKSVKNYAMFGKKNSSLVQIVTIFAKVHSKSKGEIDGKSLTLLNKILKHLQLLVSKEKGLSQIKGLLKILV